MRERAEVVIILLAVLVIAVAVAVGVRITLASRRVPQCQEYVVIVGTGDFNKGRWTTYECGPALDDFVIPRDVTHGLTGDSSHVHYPADSVHTEDVNRDGVVDVLDVQLVVNAALAP